MNYRDQTGEDAISDLVTDVMIWGIVIAFAVFAAAHLFSHETQTTPATTEASK